LKTSSLATILGSHVSQSKQSLLRMQWTKCVLMTPNASTTEAVSVARTLNEVQKLLPVMVTTLSTFNFRLPTACSEEVRDLTETVKPGVCSISEVTSTHTIGEMDKNVGSALKVKNAVAPAKRHLHQTESTPSAQCQSLSNQLYQISMTAHVSKCATN